MTGPLVSEDALVRSTFLHERDVEQSHFRPSHRVVIEAELCCMLGLLSSPSEDVDFSCDVEVERQLAAEPYACPFRFAVRSFAQDLNRKAHDVGANLEPIALSSLSCWYLSRLVDASRYVLHLTYARTGLTYSAWMGTFDQPDTATRAWLAIAEEFPVLIRQLLAIKRNCAAATQEMAERLSADRLKLASIFGIAPDDPVKQIEPGLSDPHRGGRTVMRLHFRQSGPLIYKPKPLQLDAAFQQQPAETLARMGNLGLKVLALDGYGWMEHADLEAAHSSSADPVTMARSAATFWLLNTSDLHLENIIATSKGVLALDLETLLTAPITGSSNFVDPLWRNHSIYTTLLFDFRISSNPRPRINGFDHSDLGLPYFKRPQFVLADNMMQLARPIEDESESEKNGRSPASISPDNAGKLVAAFGEIDNTAFRTSVAEFIQSLGDDIAGRVVFRDTLFYFRLLERMRQPRFLRDGAELSRDLAALHKGISASSPHAHLFHRIIDDEIFQLLDGDIPYFAMAVGGTSIETSRDNLLGFFASSAKAFALQKVLSFAASDIAEQQALIGLALGIRSSPASTQQQILVTGRQEEEDLLAGRLAEIAAEIVESAFRPDDAPARWMTMLGDVAEHELRIDVGDTGLFSGSLGILCALQAVERAVQTREPQKLSEFLDEQARHWVMSLERGREHQREVGHRMLGFLGVGGQIFALSTLARLAPHRWGDTLSLIDCEVDGIEAAIDADDWLDFTMGIAGLAIGCEHYLQLGIDCDLSTRLADIQQHCARRLAEVAVERDEALAWAVRADPKPLLSYAHGWSGIVVALAAAQGRARGVAASKLESVLDRASRYPELLLRSGRGWMDEREGTPADRRVNRSWCNGLAGFLRGVWAVHPNWSSILAAEFDRGCSHLQERLATSDSHRFCCGEFGSLDVLLDFSPTSRHQLTGMALHLLSPSCGTEASNPERIFPSAYQGRCGMIYTAARLLHRDIPSLSGQY